MDGNVFDNITITKLSNPDLNTIRNLNQRYRTKVDNYLNRRTVNEINKRLREFMSEDELKEFKQVLQETGAVISGSFVLQCALQETWEGSDIDIFIPLVGNELFKTKSNIYYTNIERFLYKKKDCRFDKYYAAERYKTDIGAAIHWIRNYSIFPGKEFARFNYDVKDGEWEKHWMLVKEEDDRRRKDIEENKSKFRIQLIQVDVRKEDIYKYIKQSFDFDIIKNVYYGGNKVDFMDIEQILLKYTYFQYPGKRLGNTVERAEKYKKRGIEIREGCVVFKTGLFSGNKNEQEEEEVRFKDILQTVENKYKESLMKWNKDEEDVKKHLRDYMVVRWYGELWKEDSGSGW